MTKNSPKSNSWDKNNKSLNRLLDLDSGECHYYSNLKIVLDTHSSPSDHRFIRSSDNNKNTINIENP